MAKVETVEALLSDVGNGDKEAIQVLEDAIREGVEGAGKARYMLVERPARRKFGVSYPAEREHGAFAVVVPGKSIRIVGIKYPNAPFESCAPYDRTFEVGDVAEYDSFNLSYHGKIVAIGARVSFEQEGYSSRKKSLTIYEFSWRNYDLVRGGHRGQEPSGLRDARSPARPVAAHPRSPLASRRDVVSAPFVTARLLDLIAAEGASGPVAAVGRAFDLMGIAEEEISAAKARAPARTRGVVDACFAALRPRVEMTDSVYRAHCRELLRRAARGEDLRDATSAEMLTAVSGASLKAMLDSTGCALMARLFARVFPERADLAEGVGREPFPGAVDEAEAALARRMRAEDRVPGEPRKKRAGG